MTAQCSPPPSERAKAALDQPRRCLHHFAGAGIFGLPEESGTERECLTIRVRQVLVDDPRFSPPVSPTDGGNHGTGRDIAIVIGIAPKTSGSTSGTNSTPGTSRPKVASNLYRIARGSGREAVTAAIFWLKVRAGRQEPLLARQYPLARKEAQQLRPAQANWEPNGRTSSTKDTLHNNCDSFGGERGLIV
jgi:hypothetical protein